MSTDGQRIKRRRNIAENFNRLSRVHERYRQTDGRTTTYSERELSLKTCTLTSRSRLESYKRLVSVSGGERLGLVSVSSFYVSCPSLVLLTYFSFLLTH